MTSKARRAALDAMSAAGVSEAAVAVFAHNFDALQRGEGGYVLEEHLDPVSELDSLADVVLDDQTGVDALAQTVVIKLNGGLGTSMGLDAAKTLLRVRDELTFLDIIARQILSARQHYGVRLPLILMNSFRTDDDTRAALATYDELPVTDLPLTFLQNQEPKLHAETLEPIKWPANPSLEWCPPGHGDLYTALLGSGLLKKLIDEGFRYAMVANGDNLGATPDPVLAGWFAQSGAPFAAEVCRRTINDRKGGHLAYRRSDGRMMLRESAMVAPDEMRFFTDEGRHPYFNTNNLWFDLRQLYAALTTRDGVLGLPLIRNEKTVDPADPDSPRVIQLETAMGAAIETFEGATAIEVPRSRFLPVKTTNELLLVRSDCYDLTEDYALAAKIGVAPEIRLDGRYFKTIGNFERRVPQAPSLVEATRLVVNGDWRFEPGVVVVGDVELEDQGEQAVARGTLS